MSRRMFGSMAADAFPLYWPEGWPRTHVNRRDDGARFRSGSAFEGSGPDQRYVGKRLVTLDAARRSLRDELSRLGAQNIVLSTNLPLRNDGEPRAGARVEGRDPGVAVYFFLKGKPMAMAQDAFTTPACNMRSLALAIGALRTLKRHGGGMMMERAFTGFTALPPPADSTPKRPWWEVLRYPADPAERELLSVPEVKARYATLAKKLHPDVGGSAEEMAELNTARDDAVKDLGGEDARTDG